MLRNYLIVAWRNLRRNKLYAAINVTGLALGMACCLLIVLFVLDALSYDRFHRRADRIYRVAVERNRWGSVADLASAPASLGPALQEAWPEVLQAIRVDPLGELVLSFGDKRFYESGVVAVDPAFLELFDFPLLQGNAATALRNPDSIVITEAMARRYFGDADPMGQSLSQFSQQLRVTGVVGPSPGPSHLGFSALVPFRMRQVQPNGEHMMPAYTYVLLDAGTEPAMLERKWPQFLDSYAGAAYYREEFGNVARFRPHLQLLTEIHWRSHLADELAPTANTSVLILMTGLAGLILGIACINYANLSIAQFARRSREVGVRKVVGAARMRLAGQFFTEAVVLAAVAMLVALVLVEALLPWYEGYLGKPLALAPTARVLLWPGLLALILSVGLGAGVYPALYLASLPPVQLLRGLGGGVGRGARVRRALVVLQFAASTALLATTAGMFAQMQAVTRAPLGFDKGQVLVVSDRDQATRLAWCNPNADFAAQLRHSTSLEAVTACSRIPGRAPSRSGKPDRAQVVPVDRSTDDAVELPVIYVDSGFVPVLGLQLVAGRNFRDQPSGEEQDAVILTEKAAQMLGWTAPVGRRLRIKGTLVVPSLEAEVIGVVRDFRAVSLYQTEEPYILRPHVMTRGDGPTSFRYNSERFILARVRPGQVSAAIEHLKAVWERNTVPLPFECHFLDEDFARIYRTAHQQTRLFGVASGVAILVACFGLFGLTAYSVQQRTREIGIRKVVGSSVSGIGFLLSREYSLLVLLGCLIACPVAYLGLHRWLQEFTYRAPLGPGIYLAAVTVTLALAWLTAAWHAVRAALANPVDALRHE